MDQIQEARLCFGQIILKGILYMSNRTRKAEGLPGFEVRRRNIKPQVNQMEINLRKQLTNIGGLSSTYINNAVVKYKSSMATNKREVVDDIIRKAKTKKKVEEAKKTKRANQVRNAAMKGNNKHPLITHLTTQVASVRNAHKNMKNTDRGGYAFLSNFYRLTDMRKEDNIKAWIKKNNSTMQNYIKRQHGVITKETSLLHTKNTTKTFVMDENGLHDLLLMFFLDMKHDKLYKGSFKDYLGSDIVKKLLKPNTTVPTYNTDSALYKKLKENNINPDTGGTVRGMKMEDAFKNNFRTLWGTSQPIQIKKYEFAASLAQLAKNKNKPIYVSIDSESNRRPISALLYGSRMTTKDKPTYFAKRLVTIPNILDPGLKFGTGLLFEDISSRVMRTENEGGPYTPYKFNFQSFEFNFGKYFTISIGPNEKGTQFECFLNSDTKLNIGTTRNEGETGNGPIPKIAKTFGDFLQVLINSHLAAEKHPAVGATGDGNFVGMTGYVQKELFKIPPRIIIDRTAKSGQMSGIDGVFIYGMDDKLKNVTRTNSGATTQTQTKPTKQQIKVNNKNLSNNANSRISGNSKRNSKSTNNSSKTPVASSSLRKPTSTPNKQGIKRKVNNAGLNNSKRSNNTSNSMNSGFSNTSNSTNVAARSQRSNNYTVNSARNLLVNGLNKLTHLTNQDKKAFISNFGSDPNVNRVLKAAKNKNTLILQEKNKFIRAIRKLTSLNKTKQNMYISSYNRGLNSENLLKRAKNDNNNAKEIAQVRRAKTLRPRSKI